MKVKSIELVVHPKVTLNNRSWKEARQYMSKGYYILQRDVGIIIMEKKPKIMITIENDDGEIKIIDFRDRLAEFYGNEFHTEQLYEMFKSDFTDGAVIIEKGINGYYVSVPATKEA